MKINVGFNDKQNIVTYHSIFTLYNAAVSKKISMHYNPGFFLYSLSCDGDEKYYSVIKSYFAHVLFLNNIFNFHFVETESCALII